MHLLRWDRNVALDDRHDASAGRAESERQRRHVQQQEVVEAARRRARRELVDVAGVAAPAAASAAVAAPLSLDARPVVRRRATQSLRSALRQSVKKARSVVFCGALELCLKKSDPAPAKKSTK